MTTSIERILSDIIQLMQLEGMQINGRLGEDWVISQVGDADFPVFLFDVENETINEDYSQTINLRYVLCFRSNTVDYFPVTEFEGLREIYLKFFNHVYNYENEEGQELIEVLSHERKPYYFDIKFLEVKTKGFDCKMRLKIQAVRRC